MPQQAWGIGVTTRLISVPEIYCPAPEHFREYASITNERFDKIKFAKPNELTLLIYMMDERFIRIPEVNKLII